MKVLRLLQVRRWRNRFSVASITLILVYIGASYFATGPILEGYQIEFASRSNGYAGFFPSIILRPLSVLPNWLAIGLSRTGINGYWVITTLFILIRVLAVYLLRSQMGRLFWPVLIFAVFLPTWPASLNERFLPAQLGSSLLLLAYASSKLKFIDSSITFLRHWPWVKCTG
jgi:hypothetical protein